MNDQQDSLLSIIYTSTAVQAFDDDLLDALLAQCRENNRINDLSGMLLYRDGRFLQVIEGPEDVLRTTMGAIKADPRHTNLRVMFEEPLEKRQFPNWTMGFRRADGENGSAYPGYRVDFDDLDTKDPTATVRALRELVRWFQERADR